VKIGKLFFVHAGVMGLLFSWPVTTMPRMALADSGNGLPLWARRVVARGVASSLTACLRRAVEVRPAEATDANGADDPAGTAAFEPTCRFAVPSGRPGLAVWFSPSLAEALLDVLLGGNGQTCTPRGPLTALDRQLLRPLVEQIAGRVSAEPDPPSPSAVEDESLPHAASEIVSCIVALSVHLDGPPLAMHLAWPCDARTLAETLLPLADEIELAAVIHESADRSALAGLADGDLLVSDVAPDGEIIVTLGGIPRFAATLGHYNGKRAVTLTREL